MPQEIDVSRILTREAVHKAHDRIRTSIHQTPVVQSQTLSELASTPQKNVSNAARPKMNLFFKCENYQKIGAFKIRGATHALSKLTSGQLEDGVITHSSGNHAQALALAARNRGVKAYIVMPSISTPSKIAATKGYGAEVVFSGSTSEEREAVVADLMQKTGARLIPPYDHPDIILGQGTMALEFESQVKQLCEGARHSSSADGINATAAIHPGGWQARQTNGIHSVPSEGLDAVIAPLGGGGMLSGIATALQGTGIAVFGAEPSFEGGDDGRRGLAADPPKRIESVSTLTIADGLRTPVGVIPWQVISDTNKVRGVYGVTDEQIKSAMRLVLERMKIFIEPSAAVPLAVALYDEQFRRLVEREAGPDGWNIGIIFSGGNTTVEAISALYGAEAPAVEERAQGTVGLDGARVAENVAG